MNEAIAVDFQMCVCGHKRRNHYEGKGTCECSQPYTTSKFNNFTIRCSCRRFKKQTKLKAQKTPG